MYLEFQRRPAHVPEKLVRSGPEFEIIISRRKIHVPYGCTVQYFPLVVISGKPVLEIGHGKIARSVRTDGKIKYSRPVPETDIRSVLERYGKYSGGIAGKYGDIINGHRGKAYPCRGRVSGQHIFGKDSDGIDTGGWQSQCL